jgi:hypothetical protein
MGPAPDVEAAAKASPLYARYGERLDNRSARAMPPDIGDFLRSRQGRRIERQVLRGVFGMLRKRL